MGELGERLRVQRARVGRLVTGPHAGDPQAVAVHQAIARVSRHDRLPGADDATVLLPHHDIRTCHTDKHIQAGARCERT